MDVNMPRLLASLPDHKEFVLVSSDNVFFFGSPNCNIWFGGECCFQVRSSLKDNSFLKHVFFRFFSFIADFQHVIHSETNS